MKANKQSHVHLFSCLDLLIDPSRQGYKDSNSLKQRNERMNGTVLLSFTFSCTLLTK